MRHRVRIQPYISPEVHRQLRLHTAARNVTDSAVAEAALAEYLARATPDEGVLLTRLQALSEDVARLQYDSDVLGQAFGTFVRFAFRMLDVDHSTEAARRSQQLFTQFVTAVSRELDAGLRLTGEIEGARRTPQPAVAANDNRGERR